MKKTIKVEPRWQYKDSVRDEDYYSSNGVEPEFDFEIDDAEFPNRKDFTSNYDYDKAYAKVYDKYKDAIKAQAISAIKDMAYSAPHHFDMYVPLEFSKRSFGDSVYLNKDWSERPDLYTEVMQELPDLDIENEGGINWNWYKIKNAQQAHKLKELASRWYPSSASRIDDITDEGAHFRLHKYDEDSPLDSVLSKLAEAAQSRNQQKNIKDTLSEISVY